MKRVAITTAMIARVCVCVRLTWMANDDLMQQMSVANTSVEGKEQQEQQRRQ